MEKTAIVTGASRGIGAAAALALAAPGVPCGRVLPHPAGQSESVAARIRAAGGTAAVFCADVSDEAAGAHDVCAGRADAGAGGHPCQ